MALSRLAVKTGWPHGRKSWQLESFRSHRAGGYRQFCKQMQARSERREAKRFVRKRGEPTARRRYRGWSW